MKLSRWFGVAAAGASLAFLPALTGAANAATAYTAPTGAGVSTQIVLENGNYSKCLNDRGQNTAPGAPVTIYTCHVPSSQAIANYWTTWPDNTIRPQANSNVAVTVDASHNLVLEPVTDTQSQTWFFRADGGIESALSTAGATEYLANDPGYNASNNVQQIIYNQNTVTTNAHWWVTAARYGTTATLSNRPDSGGGGNNWANDHIYRASMVLYMGDKTPGVHTYQGDVRDLPGSSFHALAGELTPNQSGSNAGTKLGDSLGGAMTGGTGYSFTSTQFVTSGPKSAYSGSNPSTGDWPNLFFSGSATTAPTGMYGSGTDPSSLLDNSGSVQWAWSYAGNKDNCGNSEQWTDASYNNGGQSSTAGNITAPATCS